MARGSKRIGAKSEPGAKYAFATDAEKANRDETTYQPGQSTFVQPGPSDSSGRNANEMPRRKIGSPDFKFDDGGL
jgi:hypothetical protein